MKTDYDLAIIGSGFGGSLLAQVACRLGLSVLLLEKGSHPRFAIGESTSPLANLLLEQIAQRYDLPRLLPLSSYGPWQRTYPEIDCGLKRGFTYFHHRAGQAYGSDSERRNQLLVAASPHEEVADTHWLRADVDKFLMEEAVAAGADYRDQAAITAFQQTANDASLLTVERGGTKFMARASLVIDATGPRGFLSQALGLPEAGFTDYPATQSLYSHFLGVRPCGSLADSSPTESPPYPPDAAAVHHVFDGGWMWALRFDSGVVSAGFALTDALAQEVGLVEGEPAWRRLLARFPSIGEQFSQAEAIRPFSYAPRLAYRTSQAAGPGWAMLPSAAAFVDPLFSTGIPLTLLGVERLGRILEEAWGSDDLQARMEEYEDTTLQEADATADFIGGCYAAMSQFPVFAALSMFYFAAASYSEMARRLDRRHLATRFLLSGHSEFASRLRCCTAWARREKGQATSMEIANFEAFVTDAVNRVNIAGLCDPRKRHWYGVDLADVVQGAAKLEMTPAQMQALLRTAPGRSSESTALPISWY